VEDRAVPLILSFIAIALLSVSGYLGARLVYDDGIGVGRHKRRTPTPESTLHLSATNIANDGDLAFVPIPEADRLGERETLRAEIDGQVITIAKIDENFYAFQEFCTHRFGPLSEGDFQGFNVQCPWHNSCFDVLTGKVTHGPAKVDLKSFKVETRDGKICVGVQRGTSEST
jgi:nitrite reductase/ring-hydroxylating ferredoxin subunit